jgi:SpoVK/Ycf46/Vps4 family AAA+-type ATPase
MQAELPERVAELVYAIPAQRRLDDLVLAPQVVETIREFIDEFSQSALLHSHSLEPRHTVLLLGPPGNGKTSLAEALATELSLPLLSLRYDAIVDSFLGETSSRLRRLIDYATLNPCVLFFDEFEAVGKERSDAQETGEIKRVVSSLLVQMDRLPSHTLIVCATNHPELLDRAVWRRFELKLEVDKPGPEQLMDWFRKFEATLDGPAGITAKQFADHMKGESMAAVEAFTLDVRRKVVLSRGKLGPAEAIRRVIDRNNSGVLSSATLKAMGREQVDAKRLSDSPSPARKRTRKTQEQ